MRGRVSCSLVSEGGEGEAFWGAVAAVDGEPSVLVGPALAVFDRPVPRLGDGLAADTEAPFICAETVEALPVALAAFDPAVFAEAQRARTALLWARPVRSGGGTLGGDTQSGTTEPAHVLSGMLR